MSLKEGARIVKTLAFPDRAVRNSRPYELEEDAELVPRFLQSSGIRLVALALAKSPDLPQRERVGYIYFIRLVSMADDAVDNSPEFSQPLERDELKMRLMSHPIPKTNLTIADLTERTLNHFPEQKRKVIENFLETMIDIHANSEKKYPGEYNYDNVLQYRNSTDIPWVDTISNILGIEDSNEVNHLQTLGLLFQYLDDAMDWPEDVQSGSLNLWVGLATDVAQDHPQELTALNTYIALPNEKRSTRSLRNWVKKNMPHTRREYQNHYKSLLSQLSGTARVTYWGLGKKI